MNKTIKFSEVAHLYQGNRVQVKDGGVCVLDSVSSIGICSVSDPESVDGGMYISINELTPILRPFTDMTVNEALELCKNACPFYYADYRFKKWEVNRDPKEDQYWKAYQITNPNAEGVVFQIDLIDGDIIVYVDGCCDPVYLDPNYRFTQLKMGFDCHNLIESGLAIKRTILSDVTI